MCPAVLRPGKGLVHSHEATDNMYVDIGLYGEPKISNYRPAMAKELELFVHKLKG